MIYAERGNRVKQISETDIQKYVEQGYKIVDDRGTLVMDTIPMDTATLKKAYKEHVEEIKSLKAQIDLLTAQLASAKSNTDKKIVESIELATNDKKSLVIEEQPRASTRNRKAKVVESVSE